MTTPSNGRHWPSFLVQLAFVIAILGLFSWFNHRVVESIPRVPITAVPDEPPGEPYRVFHPTGFSIIRPRSWESRVGWEPGNDAIGGIELTSPYNQDPVSILKVLKLSEEPDLAGQARDFSFQGRAARLAVERRSAEWLEHPGRLTVEISFFRNGSWWLIRYSFFQDQEGLPPVMWAYLETFSTSPSELRSSRDRGDSPGEEP